MKRIKFYLDFDGTIAQTDVVDMVLERFADKDWQKVEKEWQAGKIGSRECLTRQMALVKASPQELDELCRDVKLDEHFISFLKCAKELEVPVFVVSDGFDYLIRHVLDRALKDYPELLKALPVYSNKIEWVNGRPKAVFYSEDRCRHGCANCKPEIIKDTAWADDTVFFVGDGLSDRYAAHLANVTFAKKKLLDYCRENDLNHEPYENFGQVEAWLRKNYASVRASYEIRPSFS